MQETAVGTLTDLGLSLLQAKTYIALATSGTQTGRAVAKVAKIAPQDIYRLLGELAEEGLVEKIIDKPSKFRAIPLADGLQVLINRRHEETEKLLKAAELISKTAEAYPIRDEQAGEFVLVPKKKPVDKMVHQLFLTAKTSVDLMNESQEVLNLYERHSESRKTALRNGVQVREIIGRSTPDARLPAALVNLAKSNSLLKIKLLDSPPAARLMIKDGKEVFFATTCKPGTLSQPFLWTNNHVIVQIVQQWYDRIWSTAEDKCSK